MTDAPWDEGPVSALRARIAELTDVREALREQMVRDVAAILKLTGDRDRAVEAVRQLRAALTEARAALWPRDIDKIDAAMASTASYEEGP